MTSDSPACSLSSGGAGTLSVGNGLARELGRLKGFLSFLFVFGDEFVTRSPPVSELTAIVALVGRRGRRPDGGTKGLGLALGGGGGREKTRLSVRNTLREG